MKQIILTMLVVLVCIFPSFGQYSKSSDGEGVTSRAVYGEFFGSGLAFSANFDSRFKGSTGLGFRVGIGGAGGTGGGILTFPLGINYLAGKSAHHFEAGTTFTIVTAAFDLSGDSGSGWFVLPHIGYRYSKPSNSFNGRIYVGPFIANGFTFFPFGGISAGFTF
jgi:hypothetical protein